MCDKIDVVILGPAGSSSSLPICLEVKYRLEINMITTINKVDLLSKAKAEEVRGYLLNPSECGGETKA